eukprot:CAMPEP_0179418360 /NCGR_PEP_ID=MMETSP0799-20121207/7951_1 /TAXON_ID=46947 /ORGANISM="Geminigera cryophila, Strain CCMP2564" /LENGTH=53 /DNA_ID=CAMNT_0021191615 /DNA_START=293 /DNA_END=450 /DNA_ORIENTATION=+
MAIMFIVSNIWLGYTFLRIQVLKESCWSDPKDSGDGKNKGKIRCFLVMFLVES